MQPITLYIAVLPVVLFILQKLFSTLNSYHRARSLGCQPINRYQHTHPLGFDLHRARVDAVKTGRRNGFDLELFEKYGSTYEERAFLGKIINTCDITNMQAVGATQFQDFGREKRRAARKFFGDGILSMNGHEWKQARGLVDPLFQRAELTDIERFRKYIDRMFALIPRDGSTVDMQPLLQKLVSPITFDHSISTFSYLYPQFLDSSTEFIFGQSMDSLRDTTRKSDDFLRAFNLALAGAGKRLNMGGAFSFLYAFDKSWKENCSKVHSFIDEGIARYYSETSSSEKQDQPKERYVLIEGMAKAIKDPIKLRFHLLNIFFPARDTSAILVSNVLFFLARYPHYWQELRAEALKIKDQPLTFEMLKSLPTFRYTLFEAIRLEGPSGQVRRIALHDTTLPRGGGRDGSSPIFVPKGTLLYCNNFPGYRNKDIWGDDVLEFRPSRFVGKVFSNWVRGLRAYGLTYLLTLARNLLLSLEDRESVPRRIKLSPRACMCFYDLCLNLSQSRTEIHAGNMLRLRECWLRVVMVSRLSCIQG